MLQASPSINVNSKITSCMKQLLDINKDEETCKNKILTAIINSHCLLEEHYINLRAFLDHLCPGFDEHHGSSQDKFKHWEIMVKASLLVGGFFIGRNVKCYCPSIGNVLQTLAGTGASVWFISQMYVKAELNQLQKVTAWLEEQVSIQKQLLNLLDKCFSLMQEMILISKCSKVQQSETTRNSEYGNCLFPLQQAVKSVLKNSLQCLQDDLQQLVYIRTNSDSACLDYLSCSSLSNESLDLSFLKDMKKILLVQTSRWLQEVALAVGTCNIQCLPQLLNKISGVQYSTHLERLYHYHIDILNGKYDQVKETSNFKKPSCNDKRFICRNLHLHCRELFRLSKLLLNKEDDINPLLEAMSDQLKTALVCLDAIDKSSVVKSLPIIEQSVPQITGEDKTTNCDFSTTQPNQSITDQIFEATSLDDDNGGNHDNADFDETAQPTFGKYLMRELKGVIHGLTEERKLRESKLMNSESISHDELARFTQELIEKRDINKMLSEGDMVEPELPIPRENVRRSKYTYEETEQTESCLSTMDMKLLAETVALRSQALRSANVNVDTGDEESFSA